MAKLDNLKVVNENTVEYNGFVYEKVTIDAAENDLLRINQSLTDITSGAFYTVHIDSDGDLEILDDVNDDRYPDLSNYDYTVFRKSHAITLGDAEGVVKIELPDGTKLEGTPSDLEKITRKLQEVQQGKADMPKKAEEIEIVATEPVPCPLQVGDYAKVTGNGNKGPGAPHSFDDGEIVEVLNGVEQALNGPVHRCESVKSGESYSVATADLVRATEAEIKVANEPKDEPLKAGDYARVVGSHHSNCFGGKDGDIVKIIREARYAFETEELNGGNYELNQFALKSSLVKATEAEVLEAKQALLKEGDYARVINNEATSSVTGSHDFETGTIVKIEHPHAIYDGFRCYYLDDSDWWNVHRKDLEPLTQEEIEHIKREAEEEKKARVEREEKEAERLKWAAIGREVNQFKNGDIVRVIQVEDGITTGHPYGVIGEVVNNATPIGPANGNPLVKYEGDTLELYCNCELIVPVEQRFDTVG